MKGFEIQFENAQAASDAKLVLDEFKVTSFRKDEGTSLFVSETNNPIWELDGQFWRLVRFILEDNRCLALRVVRITVRELQ